MPPKKPQLTHFLCLPLPTHAAPQWQTSLQQFTSEIQSVTSSKSLLPPTSSTSALPIATGPIPTKAIRPVGTLHLTIGVMSLTKPEKVEAAVALLKSMDLASNLGAIKRGRTGETLGAEAAQAEGEQYKHSPSTSGNGSSQSDQKSAPQPLTLSFTGLKSMHSPKKTSFLYTAPTDPTGRLYPFCQAIKDRFIQEELMIEERRALKLHATVLNTIYAGKVYARKAEDSHSGDNEAKESGSAENLDKDGRSEEEHHNEVQPDKGPEEEEHEHAAEEHSATEPVARPQDQPGKKKGRRKKQSIRFDARDLLNRYAEFEWACNVAIGKVAICEMGAKKITNGKGEVVGEEYTEIASVRLP
ncbi:MAG: hypothetical protein Q9225_005020 [Loekoesia sp. 1 TL-2023]